MEFPHMDRAGFWKLMSAVDQDALDELDDAAAVEPLIEELSKREERQIFGFEEQLALVLYELDGRVFADHAGESASSPDGFLYARCFVVARGQEHHERVLADPSAMPHSLDEWCEALLYVASRAWAQRTGRDEEEWEFEASVSYETGSNAAKWV
jgi:hypothetical protein